MGKSLVASLFLHSAILLASVAVVQRQPFFFSGEKHRDDSYDVPLTGEFPITLVIAPSVDEPATAIPPESASDPGPPVLLASTLPIEMPPVPAPPLMTEAALPSSATKSSPPPAMPKQKASNARTKTVAAPRGRTTEPGGGSNLNTPARYAQCPAPVYPDKARKAALTGTVLLSVEIDESGRPLTVAVRNSSGHELLDQTALRAVRKWRFEPARSRGKSTGARLEIPIRFARS